MTHEQTDVGPQQVVEVFPHLTGPSSVLHRSEPSGGWRGDGQLDGPSTNLHSHSGESLFSSYGLISDLERQLTPELERHLSAST